MKRGATPNLKKLGLRRVLLLMLPLSLTGGAWDVRQLQLPIDVEILSPGLEHKEGGGFDVKTQKPSIFQQMITRLAAESRKHPFAASISVGQTTPWPKESGLDLKFSDNMTLDRHNSTLRYSTESYGWIYSHVESSGLDLLEKSHLAGTPITLPPSVHAQLRRRGWTLTEHSLP